MNIKTMPSDQIIAELVELHKTMDFYTEAVQTIDIIKSLKRYEIILSENQIKELEPIEYDNTTNYSENIDHDISISFYRDNISIISVCRFGDPRGNYTDDMILKISRSRLMRLFKNFSNCTVFENNGIDYKISMTALDTEIIIENMANGKIITCNGIDDIETTINESEGV